MHVPVEVIKEVPVEVVKYCDREVRASRFFHLRRRAALTPPTHTLCQVIKVVEKEIIKEVPVEVIKVVEKEIIKEVEVIKEVPVEIIKHMPVEVCAAPRQHVFFSLVWRAVCLSLSPPIARPPRCHR